MTKKLFQFVLVSWSGNRTDPDCVNEVAKLSWTEFTYFVPYFIQYLVFYPIMTIREETYVRSRRSRSLNQADDFRKFEETIRRLQPDKP